MTQQAAACRCPRGTPRLKLGASAIVKLPLPQYSSSRSCSLLPRVILLAHASIFSHMPPLGWLKAPST